MILTTNSLLEIPMLEASFVILSMVSLWALTLNFPLVISVPSYGFTFTANLIPLCLKKYAPRFQCDSWGRVGLPVPTYVKGAFIFSASRMPPLSCWSVLKGGLLRIAGDYDSLRALLILDVFAA
jgi:hypothetical protein